MITLQQFNRLFPHATDPDIWVEYLNHFMAIYDINNAAAFLAQCGHESMGFTRISENLNYGPPGLIMTFPRYFNAQSAMTYARKPDQIANLVYANRMGNGPVASGDGWRFRGRGILQVTGRSNYNALATAIGKGLDETITYLETIPGAIESACWFWQVNNCGAVAGDVVKLTKKINGGDNGLCERRSLYAEAQEVLA